MHNLNVCNALSRHSFMTLAMTLGMTLVMTLVYDDFIIENAA